MRQLNLGGGTPLPEGIDTTDFHRDYQSRLAQLEREAEVTLQRVNKEYIGVFETGLFCICTKPIMDHAVHYDPHHGVPIRERPFGQRQTARERLAGFRAHHRYRCVCGLKYDRTIIEAEVAKNGRGYVPREQRPGAKD